MKKVTTSFFSLFGIIAFMAVMVCSFSSCGGGDSEGGGDPGPKVTDLPEFPSGTTPATSQNVDAILAELAESGITQSVSDRMDEVVSNYYDYDDENINLTFQNEKDDDETVEVNGWIKRKETMSDSSYQITYDKNVNGKTIKNMTDDGVTIVKGSIIGYQNSSNTKLSLTGTGNNKKHNESFSSKGQETGAFTATTSSGGVKIILNVSFKVSASASVHVYEHDDGYSYPDDDEFYDALNSSVKETYSGSLKVYGENNALLKSVPISNLSTLNDALSMIGYDPSYGSGFGSEGRPKTQYRPCNDKQNLQTVKTYP